MRLLIIGGEGTIGSKVSQHFKQEHEVIVAGRSSGTIQVDIEESTSIRNMFEQVGEVDAVICIAGESKWAAFNELSEDDYYIGLRSKLMGQVNVVRIGRDYLAPQGSITLSTGILADHPVVKTASAAMVNGAIHSFVMAVGLEAIDYRVNVVSLGMVEDAYDKYKDYFAGYNPIPMDKVVNTYIKSVMGHSNGEVIRYYDNC